MSYDINSQQVDIETLFKQNENDLTSIKELYRKLKELEKKISQIKYIDSNLADKLKKDYEKLKKLILDENIQVELSNSINEINSQLGNIVRNGISVKEFNTNENVTDYTDVFNLAFSYAFETGLNICIPEGKYTVRGGITCSPLIHIIPIGIVEIEDTGIDYDYTMKVQSLD